MKKKVLYISLIFTFILSLVGINISFANPFVMDHTAHFNGIGGVSKPSSSKPSSSKPSSSRPSSSDPEPDPPPPPPITIYDKYKRNDFTADILPDKSLYKLGDEISLYGNRDVEEFVSRTVPAGSSGAQSIVPTGTSHANQDNKYFYYVKIEFKGFRVNNISTKEFNEKNDRYNIFEDKSLQIDWKTEKLKITELVPSELEYASNSGVAIGEIIVTSDYNNNNSKPFTIPFQFAPEGYTVDVYSDNTYLGIVSDSLAGKFEGQDITVTATERVEGAFKHWYEIMPDGSNKTVSHDKNYLFTMPNRNMVLVAHFEYEVNTKKLWVTSNNTDWGETWTYDNNGTKTTYVEEAVPDKKYELEYKAKPGYKFVRWEYRPYLDNEFEKNGQIKMPAHDITVTAIFEKEDKEIDEMAEKNLIITVNNPEWGRAGDSVINAIPGTEYPIWQQAKAEEGYYFTGWIYSPTYLDNPLTLQTSIIMPEETTTVTAFFSPITTLYSVDTDVEPPEGGKVVGIIPNEAAPGQKFEVSVEVNEGYEFDYWYYIEPGSELDPESKKIIVSREPTVTITMPSHELILVAVFKKVREYNLYVTSNNPEWGEAWTTPDNSDEHIWERLATEGKEYSINAQPNTGYEFVKFIYKPEIENYLEDEGKIKMPAHDITVTAIFKEKAPEPKDDPTLYISVNNPKWGKAYVVDKSGEKHYANEDPFGQPTSFKAKANETYKIAYEANEDEGYKFVGWYTSPDIGLEDFSENIKMPNQNLTLTAFFSLDLEVHSLTVIPKPENGGEVEWPEEDGYYYGRSYTVTATPNDGWELDYWYYFDESGKKIIESRKEEFDFEMPNFDVELYAKFKEDSNGGENNPETEEEPIEPSDPIPPTDFPIPPETSGRATSFEVISVRDLRWKDHFVDKYGNYIDANSLTVPNANELIVKQNGYPTELKMGYAVEFEMKTIMISPDNAKLVITPEIYKGNNLVVFSKIVDGMSGDVLPDSYKKIEIFGKNNLNKNTSFQTKSTSTIQTNNETNYDEITWNWLYYLPAQLLEKVGQGSNERHKEFDDDITIKFNIELHDMSRTNTKVLDYVKMLEENKISKWRGKVFKYSCKESLLDDIYDNAAN